MRRERVPEIHYYEWSVIRWTSSPTREMLNAAGRGIYRELMDRCYTQGSIPASHELLARICASTSEEFEAAWDVIQGHFPQDKKNPDLRVNKHATLYRKSFFTSKKRNRENGVTGGRPKVTDNPSDDKQIKTTGLPDGLVGDNPIVQDSTEQKRKEQKRTESLSEFGFDDAFREFSATYPAKGRTNQVDAEQNYTTHLQPFFDRRTEHNRIIARMRERWTPSDLWAKGFVKHMDEFIRNKRWDEQPERATAQEAPQQLPTAADLMRRDREEQERRAVNNA